MMLGKPMLLRLVTGIENAAHKLCALLLGAIEDAERAAGELTAGNGQAGLGCPTKTVALVAA